MLSICTVIAENTLKNPISVSFTGAYRFSDGTISNVYNDDTSYIYVGETRNKIGIDAYIILNFNLTLLGNSNKNEIQGLDLITKYCHDGSDSSRPSCNGDSAEGIPNGDQKIEAYNGSSDSWVRIGNLATNDNGYEVRGNWNIPNDLVNNNFVSVRLQINYSEPNKLQDDWLMIDYIALNVSYKPLPEEMTIISPVDNEYYSTSSILLNVSSNGTLKGVNYQINSGELISLENITDKNWFNTIMLNEGEYNLTFYANDPYDNQLNKSVLIYVDLTNPGVNDFSCILVNNSIECSALVEDNLGLNYAILSYNTTGTWVNSSPILLSGTSNTLNYTISIVSENSTIDEFSSELYIFDLSGMSNITTFYYSNNINNQVSVTSGSSGGGGSYNSQSKRSGEPIYVETSKEIEILRRGNEINFDVDISNDYDSSELEDLTLEIKGLEKYIDYSPPKLSSINDGETKSFRVTIIKPSYEEYEEHYLTVRITGDILREDDTISEYTQVQKIKLIIKEITLKEEAISKLKEAEEAIASMNEKGFNVTEVNVLFNEAKEKIDDNKYSEAIEITNKIIEIEEKSLLADNLIRRVVEAHQDPKKEELLAGYAVMEFEDDNADLSLNEIVHIKGKFSSEEVTNLVGLAVSEFENGDYDGAIEDVETARELLISERKGNILLFFYLYWYYLLLGLVLTWIIARVCYKNIKKRRTKKSKK